MKVKLLKKLRKSWFVIYEKNPEKGILDYKYTLVKKDYSYRCQIWFMSELNEFLLKNRIVNYDYWLKNNRKKQANLIKKLCNF